MNNRLVIVEGQDNCGKSTLLRKLRKKIDNPNIITLASSSPPKNTGQDWNIKHYSSLFDTMLNLVTTKGYDILADRFHIGETCYGPRFRNADSEYIWELESAITDAIQAQVYLLVLTDNGLSISDREDGYSIEQSAEEFDEIGKLFTEGFNKSSIRNKKLINISNNGWPDVDEIYNWIYGESLPNFLGI